ncbi:MAG: hypothetical protein F4Y44_02785 [Chloroflexi bacterium]|nr:hypothetical protein [Chloroflexota bacterium]
MATATDTERTGERLAHLEGAYAHLATKSDLERSISSLIKWMVGIAVALFVPIYGVLITILILLLGD